MENPRFKFRFYDKQCKMYLSDGYYINGNKWMDDYYEDVCDLPEYVIPEQCTGLKDKNGNLIYEGDVVKEPLLGREYIIKWQSDDAMFEAIATVYDTEFEEIYGLYVDNAKKLEITGNIHEQAEQKDK